MKLFVAVNLDDKYIRHNVQLFCHGHPTQPDGVNAAIKELLAVLKTIDWVELNGQQVKGISPQNITISNGIATIVVSKVNDGTHDIQASDLYSHLFDSPHVHFMKSSIDHTEIQNAGNWSHFELEDGLREIRNYLGREMLSPNSLSIVSPSLSVERYQGMPCVRTTDNTYIGFKASIDGDAYWCNSLREVYVEFVYLDLGDGNIETSWYYNGGLVDNWDISVNVNKSNSGMWKRGVFDGELRFYGEFVGHGNADILLRGTEGIVLNAVRVYTNEQSWMNATMTEGCRLCEWRAAV